MKRAYQLARKPARPEGRRSVMQFSAPARDATSALQPMPVPAVQLQEDDWRNAQQGAGNAAVASAARATAAERRDEHTDIMPSSAALFERTRLALQRQPEAEDSGWSGVASSYDSIIALAHRSNARPGNRPVAENPTPVASDGLGVQTKLEASEPDDEYEDEADGRACQQGTCAASEADDVPPVQSKCEACESEDQERSVEPVQEKCASCESQEPVQQGEASARSPDNIHRHARVGLREANQPLPHGERIQASFGRHDISDVRVDVGGSAASASRGMGALAFTSGSRIGFRDPPSLRLAAHEAAHVVQQRQGVHLEDDVGRPGDSHERHADAVADRVVAGGSAEDLLGDTHYQGNDARGIQLKRGCGGTCRRDGNGEAVQQAAPVQMELVVNARRLFEERVESASVSPEAEQGAEASDRSAGAETSADTAGASESSGEGGGSEESQADAGESDASSGGASASAATPSGSSIPATEGGGPASGEGSTQPAETPPPGAPQTGETADGSEQPQPASGCTPACYREPSEEPAEEPDDAPPNPPQGEVEAEASEGDEEDLPEIDECPTSEVEAASAASETPEAATTEATGGGEAAGEGGPATAGGASPVGASAESIPASTASPLAGLIAAAESQRAVAVSAYAESSAVLGGATATTRTLRRGVQFTESPGESAARQAQRRRAANRADRFFAGIADRLDQAIAHALTDVPDQLGVAAESAKAQISGSMETQKAAISTRIEQARRRARANAAMARHAVREQTATYITDVEAATLSAIESLTATHSETMGQVNDLETTTLDSINEIYAQGRAELEGLGTTVGGECTAKGAEFATQYEGFRACTEDGFWDGNLAERRANAQADAARSVAESYHDRMVDAAQKRAREVTRNGRRTDRCSIIASANQSRDTLDEQLPTLINALEMTRNAAIQQAWVTRDSLISSIDSSLAATLGQLNQQERSQRQAINDTGYMHQVLQEQVAHSAASAVQLGVQTAVASVQQAMFDVQARFAASSPPDAVTLDRALSEVEQRVNTAMDGLHTSAHNGAMTAETQLVDAARQALTSLESITQSNAELAASVSDGFGNAMTGIAGVDNFATQRTTVTEQIQQATDAGSQALSQVLDGFQQSCDSTMEGARTQLTRAHESLEQNLRQSKEGLECEITRKADEAAAKEPPAWKRVVAALLVIIVIIIVIAVTVITAGAAGPVIVAALGGPLLAGAIIGAAVGAVVSGLLAMASNLWNNRDVMEGVGQAVLVGFITGAAGGFIGAAAGAGAGILFQGASKAVQTAAQFGAAMISAGGFDVVTQYVMGGFSFDNFSVTNLATTLIITALTFGLAHRVSAGAGAGRTSTTDTPEPVTTTDTPEPVTT
ncbi:MAG: DUF4157 domain-containing protein, partial [Proteobacteria bacterium]|nr:DUF4157 domain-containing protein [Pseudomonadota bacterium]